MQNAMIFQPNEVDLTILLSPQSTDLDQSFMDDESYVDLRNSNGEYSEKYYDL